MGSLGIVKKMNFEAEPLPPEFGQKLIKIARVLYLSALLIFILLLQTAQATFINTTVLIPIYLLLTLSFFMNSVFLIASEKIQNSDYIHSFLFALDAIIITGFNYYAQGNYAIFMILYLFNIILCGLRYRTSGAIMLAMWTSILFSILLVLGPQLSGQSLYVSLVLNNFAFFAMAYLSGGVSQRLLLLNNEVELKKVNIKELQRLNEMIVSNIANGLISVDENWRITKFNQAAEKILDSKLEGLSLREVLFNKFEALESVLPDPVTGGTQRTVLEIEIRGHVKDLEVVVSPMRDMLGKAHGYVILLQDLTKIKGLERELKQQEKLAAVGQLAAGIAHEIRNPLASISGSIQLLATGGISSLEDNKKLMGITVKEIDRLNNLISEFLEYVKPEQSGKDVIDLNDMLKELLSMLKLNERLNKDVEQNVHLNAKKLITGNSSKLKQALLNILINSYQAMSGKMDGVLSVTSYDDKSSVVIMVRDNGSGISKNSIDKIFEPFHTTKSNGTGLGLAVTHKILSSHGASIKVDSDEGQGCTFTIEFDITENPIGQEMKLRKEA